MDEKCQQTAYKILFGELSCDVIFAAGRHVATKATSGPVLQVWNIRVEIDEKRIDVNTNG
jgi:hypothetical protein